jgi:hypothetical protein
MVYMAAVSTWDTTTGMTAKRFEQVACKDNNHVVYIHTRLTLKDALNYSKDRRRIIDWTKLILVGRKEILVLNNEKIFLFVNAWPLVYRLVIVCIATWSLRVERSADRIPVWTRFFTPVHKDPVAHPASYRNVPDLSSVNNVAGACHWPPTPFRPEIKERVQLQFYAPSGTPWPVVGWTSHLMHDYCHSCLPNCSS